MKHRDDVEKYEGNLNDLAFDIGNMKYDALAEFLGYLAADFKRQSKNDGQKGRRQLSEAMDQAAGALKATKSKVEKAWDISEPYMKD